MTPAKIAQFRVGPSNFNYLVYSEQTKVAIAIDPFEAAAATAKARELGVKIRWILNTHGHWDHVQGNDDLSRQTQSPIAAPAKEEIPRATRLLEDGEVFSVEDLALQVLFTPGHTAGHICLQIDPDLLITGDTLFLAGCGNCKFGGNVDLLFQSLQKIARLPDHLKIFCGHDYAQKNLEFCRKIDPANSAIPRISEKVNRANDRNETCISTLGEEKQHNVLLRAAIGHSYPAFGTEPLAIFRALRSLRDRF